MIDLGQFLPRNGFNMIKNPELQRHGGLLPSKPVMTCPTTYHAANCACAQGQILLILAIVEAARRSRVCFVSTHGSSCQRRTRWAARCAPHARRHAPLIRFPVGGYTIYVRLLYPIKRRSSGMRKAMPTIVESA